MNPAFFITDLEKKELTDVTIKFIDRNDQISTLDAHKLVLSAMSPFLHRLFRFEKKNHFEIHIADSDCAINIIKEFYQIKFNVEKDWLYILNEVACKHFLQMPIDKTVLYDIVVPNEGFKLLIELIEMVYVTWEFGIKDRKILQCIQHNFSCDDITLHPRLTSELDKLKYITVTSFLTNINFINLFGKKLSVSIYNPKPKQNLYINICKCIFSPDRRLMILLPEFIIINIDEILRTIINAKSLDTLAKVLINQNKQPINIKKMIIPGQDINSIIISPDNSYVICKVNQVGQVKSKIMALSIHDNRLLWTKNIAIYFKNGLAFTPDSQKILYIGGVHRCYIRIINAINGSFGRQTFINVDLDPTNAKMKISPNGRFIAFNCETTIKICELTINSKNNISLKFVYLIEKLENLFDHPFEFSFSSQMILVPNDYCILVYDLLQTKIIFSAEFPVKSAYRVKDARFSTNSDAILVLFNDSFREINIKNNITIHHESQCFQNLITIIEEH